MVKLLHEPETFHKTNQKLLEQYHTVFLQKVWYTSVSCKVIIKVEKWQNQVNLKKSKRKESHLSTFQT